MIRINVEKLNAKQVNDIIILVRDEGGQVFGSKKEKKLEIDLGAKTLPERIKVLKEIIRIKKEN